MPSYRKMVKFVAQGIAGLIASTVVTVATGSLEIGVIVGVIVIILIGYETKNA